VKKASEHGVDGLIIPDLPIEEADEYVQIARKESVDTIFLVTPLTSESRLASILATPKASCILSLHWRHWHKRACNQTHYRYCQKSSFTYCCTVPLAVVWHI